ncbi:hypothetical protein LCGC14_1005680 [marine sediment metagenome]|uniref:Uncharacterized protein n=1 Tax=marine sediment metagenome TaxID=412755 RepID=A0A0F9NN68_9ZZZZ
MTNHVPLETESYIQHYGRKMKEFKIKEWKDEYRRREERKKLKENDKKTRTTAG